MNPKEDGERRIFVLTKAGIMERSILLNMTEEEFKNLLRETIEEALRNIDKRKSSEQNLLSVEEASVFLKLKITTLYEKAANKLIPHFKKGNRLYFYRNELEAWLRQGKVKTLEELRDEASAYLNSHSKWKK